MDCPVCEGDGKFICRNCNGLGSRYPERPNSAVCWLCQGTGWTDCERCKGDGELDYDDPEFLGGGDDA